MDGYEVRLHVNSILAMLGEILAEVKGLREDYAEGQAATYIEVGEPEPIDFDKLLQDAFHTSYER